jgi:quinohemoprotein ethanol dehydrogenase
VKPVDDPAFVVDGGKAQSGGVLFAERCIVCHGLGAVAAGYAPDLRASALSLDATAFQAVVQGGGLEIAGMPRFEELGAAELESLRHYLRARARGAP